MITVGDAIRYLQQYDGDDVLVATQRIGGPFTNPKEVGLYGDDPCEVTIKVLPLDVAKKL